MKISKPTIYDPAFLPNNIYSGVPSWLNLPVLENESELSSMDAVVTGVPWEGGCTIGGYSSCTEGPKAIRSVSIRYTGYLPDFDLDAFDYLKVGDFGDVACRNGDYPLTFAAIRERISQIEDADALPITFGGDHGIAIRSSVRLQNVIQSVSAFSILMPILTITPTLVMMNMPAALRSISFTMIRIWIPQRSFTSVSADRVTIKRNLQMQKNTVQL